MTCEVAAIAAICGNAAIAAICGNAAIAATSYQYIGTYMYHVIVYVQTKQMKTDITDLRPLDKRPRL